MTFLFSRGQHTRSPATALKQLWLGFSALLLLICCTPLPTAAANSGVSQGYTTTETNLPPGTVMGLSGNDHSAVPATSGHNYQLLGLVADAPLIALSDGSNQVQIVVSGISNALVSTINGDIKAGDKITASPIGGVGMKATDAGQVVGTAQADMSKSNLTSETVTDKYGKSQTIEVGHVPLQVSVSYFAGVSDQGSLASILPPFILHTANGIAGQTVSPLRVLISLLVLIFGFVIVGNMLQSAIRSNIIAMGRNPLAKQALHRELLDVCFTALGVLVVTALVVYIIIKI